MTSSEKTVKIPKILNTSFLILNPMSTSNSSVSPEESTAATSPEPTISKNLAPRYREFLRSDNYNPVKRIATTLAAQGYFEEPQLKKLRRSLGKVYKYVNIRINSILFDTHWHCFIDIKGNGPVIELKAAKANDILEKNTLTTLRCVHQNDPDRTLSPLELKEEYQITTNQIRQALGRALFFQKLAGTIDFSEIQEMDKNIP